MNILHSKSILTGAVGLISGLLIAVAVMQFVYPKPVVAADRSSLSKDVSSISAPLVKKAEPMPVVMTPTQMLEVHAVERFYDAQLGVVCYRMVQKNAMSCVPVNQTWMRHRPAQ